MNNKVPFATLEKFLLGMNFVDKSVPGSHHWLEHPASGTVLVFRPYQSGELVALADLKSTRKMLDENGVLRAEQFDQGLYELSAA